MRREIAIGAIGVISAVFAWHARDCECRPMPSGAPAPSPAHVSAPPAPQQIASIAANVVASNPLRDIFRYRETRTISPPTTGASPVVIQPMPMPALTSGQAGAPVLHVDFPYNYLGTFGPDAQPFAVFAHAGDVVTARAGETIGTTEFFVREIGIETITVALRSDPTNTAQRIPIGLNAAQ